MDCAEPLFLCLSLFGVGCSLYTEVEGRTRFLMERIVPDKNGCVTVLKKISIIFIQAGCYPWRTREICLKAGTKERESMTQIASSLKRFLAASICALMMAGSHAVPASASDETTATEKKATVASENMYRLYNPNTGEHFYTANTHERDSLRRQGWQYENIGWVAPTSGTPVYRLYNPHAKGGDHHYTKNRNEVNALKRAGWRYENIGWYSGGSYKVYRQYNPHAVTGTHNYTTSKAENNKLVKAGWKAEGIGWNAVAPSRSDPTIDKTRCFAIAGNYAPANSGGGPDVRSDCSTYMEGFGNSEYHAYVPGSYKNQGNGVFSWRLDNGETMSFYPSGVKAPAQSTMSDDFFAGGGIVDPTKHTKIQGSRWGLMFGPRKLVWS